MLRVLSLCLLAWLAAVAPAAATFSCSITGGAPPSQPTVVPATVECTTLVNATVIPYGSNTTGTNSTGLYYRRTCNDARTAVVVLLYTDSACAETSLLSMEVQPSGACFVCPATSVPMSYSPPSTISSAPTYSTFDNADCTTSETAFYTHHYFASQSTCDAAMPGTGQVRRKMVCAGNGYGEMRVYTTGSCGVNATVTANVTLPLNTCVSGQRMTCPAAALSGAAHTAPAFAGLFAVLLSVATFVVSL